MLLNATLLLNAGSVVMTPDTPLLLFWTAALASLGRLLRTGNAAWWLVIGAAAGLALDSKYTAVLLAPSLLAWLVLVPAARRWLRCWQLWAASALALLLFLPVIGWNATHGWASFAKQGGRTGQWHPYDAVRFLGELLAGQVGLATPLVFCLLCLGVARAIPAARRGEAEAGLLLALTVIPGAVFVQHALGDRVQANWPAILYPGAAIAGAVWARRFWLPASLSGLAVALVVFVQAAAAPLALPRVFDVTLIRLAGWSDLAGAVFVAREAQHAGFVAADEYGLASELAFRLPGDVVSAEPRWRLFALPTVSLAGRTGILVRSMRQPGEPDPGLWPMARLIGTCDRGRRGITAERYRLYLVTGGQAAAVLLPHRGGFAAF
jgi:4-amino-4-deoxy-L-arabinose transferase-like glycosyltransferase